MGSICLICIACEYGIELAKDIRYIPGTVFILVAVQLVLIQ